jgi:hypothetical protein
MGLLNLPSKELQLTIWHLIEEAEKMDMGCFTFNAEKHKGFAYDIFNLKMYSVGDFVDMVMHERLRLHTMLER